MAPRTITVQEHQGRPKTIWRRRRAGAARGCGGAWRRRRREGAVGEGESRWRRCWRPRSPRMAVCSLTTSCRPPGDGGDAAAVGVRDGAGGAVARGGQSSARRGRRGDVRTCK